MVRKLLGWIKELFTLSNIKNACNGWNKFLSEPIDKTEETEAVSINKIVQLRNNVALNSQNIMQEEVSGMCKNRWNLSNFER